MENQAEQAGVKVVRLPDEERFEELFDGDAVGAHIIALYKALGWDGETQLDPTQVKINPVDLSEVMAFSLAQMENIPSMALMSWVSVGPSGGDQVARGTAQVPEWFGEGREE